MSILVVEDSSVDRLAPITLARPAFAISCGAARLIDQLAGLGQSLHAVVRPHLRAIVAADYPELSVESPSDHRILIVNARLVPSVAARTELSRILQQGRAGVVRSNDTVAAALITHAEHLPAELTPESITNFLETSRLPELKAEFDLLQYSHDVIRYHLTTIVDNLQQRIAEGDYREVADGVFAAEGVVLGDLVATDTSAGPMLLERGARVGPLSYLAGPGYVGVNARISERSSVKTGTCLGHTTKVGGEIGASIIEPYSNKSHYGFLGHSYLGSWVNLGAGTSNSDLKNTYGQISVDRQGERIATGMQLLGTVVGDYTKTAIGTKIFTGKTIGACSMAYGFVTTSAPSFVNYARQFGQLTEMPVDVQITTQGRMFARRDVPQRECDRQLLRDLFVLTQAERDAAGTRPGQLSF